MTRSILIWAITGLVVAAISSGCIWTPNTPASVPPTTAEYELDAEVVTDSELVWQDTTPVLHGRYAFKRGSDQLLVLTRTTSVSDVQDKGQRRDEYVERLWVTIPFGAPMGAEIDLLELEGKFLIGYERDNQRRGMYRRPCRTTGRVAMLKADGQQAVIRIDARVAPWRELGWRLTQTLTVPMTESGIQAAMYQPVQQYQPGAVVYDDEPLADIDAMEDANEEESGTADVVAVADAPGDVAPRSPVGKWFGQHGGWEYRFQFNLNGTYIRAATRGIAPMVLIGKYTTRGQFLILDYLRYYQLNANNTKYDHMNFLDERSSMVKISWQGSNMVIHGTLPDLHGTSPYLFQPDSFPDLRLNRPPTELTKG